MDKIQELINKIDQWITDIYVLRQTSILKDGEYGIGNHVFKEARNKGLLDDLKQRKIDLETKEMSLEERSKMEDYKFDLHGAIEQMKAINEDFQQPAPELTDELKDYLHRALDDWYDSKVKNRFDPQVNNMVATYSAQGGDPVDTVNMVDDDAYLKGIVTDYAMGDNDTAKTVADYSLRYLNDKMNPPIQEEAEPEEEEPHFVDNRLAAILGYGDDYGYDEYDLGEGVDEPKEEEPHFVDNRLASILGYGDDYGYDEYDLDESQDDPLHGRLYRVKDNYYNYWTPPYTKETAEKIRDRLQRSYSKTTRKFKIVKIKPEDVDKWNLPPEEEDETIHEAADQWRETPYGFSELDYNGFVISKHSPSSMIGFGYPYSVDFYGDEAGFDSLEDAKAAIDQEVNESLNECGDGATQVGNMGQFNTNILDWGVR